MRCEGSGDRQAFLLLRAFEVGYLRGIALVYGWLGVAPPEVSTRAISHAELRREVQRLEDEEVRRYE